MLRIIRELLEITPEGKGTDIPGALGHFLSAMKKRTVAFMLSDYISWVLTKSMLVDPKSWYNVACQHGWFSLAWFVEIDLPEGTVFQ